MNKPKNKAMPEAAADDMDGGFTVADGQKMRIILDGRGVYKTMIPAGSSLPEPSSMDEASERARTSIPAARTGAQGGQGGQGGALGGGQGEGGEGIPQGPAGGPGAAGGFKAPT